MSQVLLEFGYNSLQLEFNAVSEASIAKDNKFTFISSIKGENPPTSVMKVKTDIKNESSDPLT